MLNRISFLDAVRWLLSAQVRDAFVGGVRGEPDMLVIESDLHRHSDMLNPSPYHAYQRFPTGSIRTLQQMQMGEPDHGYP